MKLRMKWKMWWHRRQREKNGPLELYPHVVVRQDMYSPIVTNVCTVSSKASRRGFNIPTVGLLGGNGAEKTEVLDRQPTETKAKQKRLAKAATADRTITRKPRAQASTKFALERHSAQATDNSEYSRTAPKGIKANPGSYTYDRSRMANLINGS
jgi:hypothetical protein